MPIGEFPILEVIVRQLVKSGFDHITMAVNHQAEIIKAFFQDGKKWGIKIDYSLEDKPLGTMAPLRLIPDLPDNFLVMNGDILTDLDFRSFHDSHVSSDSLFTISSYMREQLVDYGVLDVDGKRQLNGFREKPRFGYEVSMGIYMCSKNAVHYIPDNKAYGFDELVLELMARDQRVDVRKFGGYWLDIGRPDDYAKAIDEFESMRDRFLDD